MTEINSCLKQAKLKGQNANFPVTKLSMYELQS